MFGFHQRRRAGRSPEIQMRSEDSSGHGESASDPSTGLRVRTVGWVWCPLVFYFFSTAQSEELVLKHHSEHPSKSNPLRRGSCIGNSERKNQVCCSLTTNRVWHESTLSVTPLQSQETLRFIFVTPEGAQASPARHCINDPECLLC